MQLCNLRRSLLQSDLQELDLKWGRQAVRRSELWPRKVERLKLSLTYIQSMSTRRESCGTQLCWQHHGG
jgi:hypothetical protein